jgi:hypothetical protein
MTIPTRLGGTVDKLEDEIREKEELIRILEEQIRIAEKDFVEFSSKLEEFEK